MDNNSLNNRVGNSSTNRPVRPTRPAGSPTGTRPVGTATRPTSQASSPISAEDKLRKSMKGLSYTGSSSSGSRTLNTKQSMDATNQSARKKVGGIVLDVETIQQTHNKGFETKGRRNNVIILILAILLVVSLVYLVVTVLNYINSKKDPNCKYRVQGEATWIIDGKTKTDFRVHNDLESNTIYLLNSQLRIDTNDEVEVIIEINVLFEGNQIFIAGLDNPHDKLVRVKDTNRFRLTENIVGGGTHTMFEGIDFTDTPIGINADDVVIEVVAQVKKVTV